MKKLLISIACLALLFGSYMAGFNVGKSKRQITVRDITETTFDNIIIKNKQWDILYGGIVEKIQDTEYLNYEVKEINVCADEPYTLILFI